MKMNRGLFAFKRKEQARSTALDAEDAVSKKKRQRLLGPDSRQFLCWPVFAARGEPLRQRGDDVYGRARFFLRL